MGFGAPLPFDLPTAPSQVTNGDRARAGRLHRRRRAGQRRVRPGRDVRDAAPDGAGGGDHRERRRADAAAPRDGDHRRDSGTRTIGPERARPRDRRGRRAGDQRGDGRRPSRASSGAQFTTGAKVPGVTDRRQVRNGRARRHAASRIRGSSGSRRPRRRRSPSPSSSSRAVAGAEVAAPIAGDLMTPWLGARAGDRRPGPATGATRTASRRAPLIERIGLAAIAVVLARPVRRRRGRGVGRRRGVPRGHGRDRLPDDRLGRRR